MKTAELSAEVARLAQVDDLGAAVAKLFAELGGICGIDGTGGNCDTQRFILGSGGQMGLLDDLLRSALVEPADRAAHSAGRSVSSNRPCSEHQCLRVAAIAGGILMALLPVVLGMLANRGGGAPQSGSQGGGGLGDLIGSMLGGGATSSGGGLGDLLQRFQQAGFGEQAQSWVGTGQNQSISPDVIGQIFGSGGLSQIAQQAGLSEQETSEGLSQLLPDVVDRFTPDGQVPNLDQLSASVEALARQFRG
ncbi:MAG: YidB family protein [Burkholderiales bacterium]